MGELQASAIGQLPAQIEAAFDGNYATPAWRWLNYASGQATPASRLTGATADGMYYSTMCNYAAGLERYNAQDAPICVPCPEEEILHPSIATYASFMLAPCTFWNAGAASTNVTAPLSNSPIPTLLLSGAYDCALPSYLSQGLAERLGNSYHFVLPVGHAVALSPCGLYLTEQFLTDPTTRPDAACIDAMQIYWSVR